MNEELGEPKRGPGRPPKEDNPVKKGHSTWKPANVDETFQKDPDFRYRWINEDEGNVAKKKMEHWDIVSEINGSSTTSEVGYGRVNDGSSLTSVRKRVGQVLARMPEEEAKERDAYFNRESERRTASLKREVQKDLGGAPVHGSITMDKKGIRNVIKD